LANHCLPLVASGKTAETKRRTDERAIPLPCPKPKWSLRVKRVEKKASHIQQASLLRRFGVPPLDSTRTRRPAGENAPSSCVVHILNPKIRLGCSCSILFWRRLLQFRFSLRWRRSSDARVISRPVRVSRFASSPPFAERVSSSKAPSVIGLASSGTHSLKKNEDVKGIIWGRAVLSVTPGQTGSVKGVRTHPTVFGEEAVIEHITRLTHRSAVIVSAVRK
ncbi:hypothetical protein EDB84DRAFT_1679470, partial [Lactarius hengduanensis]